MRRIGWVLAVCCWLMVMLGVQAAALEIEQYQGECVLDENGVSRFTVRYDLQFDTPQTSFSLGLGKGVHQVQAQPEATRTERDKGVTRLIFENEAGFSGTMTVNVTYEIETAVQAGLSDQKLSLPLLAAQEGELQDFSFTVRLPRAFEATPEFSGGYLAGAVDNYMELSVKDGTVRSVMQQPLMAGDQINMSLELPAGYFQLLNVAGQTRKVDQYVLLLCFPAGFFYWFFLLRYPWPRLQRQSQPPAGTNAGVLRYILTGRKPDLALMCASWASAGYLLIRRSARGGVRLQRRMRMGNERAGYEARIFAKLFEKAQTVEAPGRAYLAAERFAQAQVRRYWDQRLFYRSGGSAVVLRIIAVLGGTAAGMAAADELLPSVSGRWLGMVPMAMAAGALFWLVGQGVIHLLDRRPGKWLAAGGAALVALTVEAVLAGTGAMLAAALLLQAAVAVLLLFGRKRSRNGLQVLEQTLSLRRYLQRLNPKQVRTLHWQYFHQTLPEAEALGLGRRFAQLFSPALPEPCTWLEAETKRGEPIVALKDPVEFYDQFYRCLRVMRGEDRPTVLQRLGLRLLRIEKKKRRKPAKAGRR